MHILIYSWCDCNAMHQCNLMEGGNYACRNSALFYPKSLCFSRNENFRLLINPDVLKLSIQNCCLSHYAKHIYHSGKFAVGVSFAQMYVAFMLLSICFLMDGQILMKRKFKFLSSYHSHSMNVKLRTTWSGATFLVASCSRQICWLSFQTEMKSSMSDLWFGMLGIF